MIAKVGDLTSSGVVATVKNVGAVELVEIPLVPGVVTVLTGRNGIGKTTAATAVIAALGGDSADLSPRDGCEAGHVTVGQSVSVRIGKRISRKGESETFCVMEDGGDLQKFIDPGIKDPKAADARRIEAMLTLSGATVDAESIAAMIGDRLSAEFANEVETRKLGAVEIVSKLVQWLQKKARDLELEVSRLEGEISGLAKLDGPLPTVDVLALETEAMRLRDEVQRITGARQSAAEAQASIERIKSELAAADAGCEARLEESLAAVDTINGQIEAVHKDFCSAETAYKQAVDEVNQRLATMKAEHHEAVARMNEKLAEQKERRSAAEADARVAQSQVKARTEGMARLAELEESVSKVMGDEAFEDLKSRSELAKTAHSDGIILAQENRRKVEENARRNAKVETHKNQSDLAVKARDMAKKAPQILGAAVSKLPGWSINDDMRLCCVHSRGSGVPFAALSPGEQAIRAIEIATGMKKPKKGMVAVVGIPQPVWESLDDDNRELVQKYASEHGLSILAIECSHGAGGRKLSASLLS